MITLPITVTFYSRRGKMARPVVVPNGFSVGSILSTKKHGDIRVVKYHGAIKVEVEFVSTGFRLFTSRYTIEGGNLRDPLFPYHFGIGYQGVGKHKTKVKEAREVSYQTWMDILFRCYSPKAAKKFPAYIGCTVCKEWHNFQNFAEWFKKGYKKGLVIDKDIKIKGNKEYSPLACSFVTKAENTVAAHAKHYSMTNPDGVVVDIFNMSEFCRVNNLSQAHMNSVVNGKRRIHKGWTR